QEWQSLFDGKTTNGWKTEGQVRVVGSILRIGGDGKGGSILSNAPFARGQLTWSVHHTGDAKATPTWRGAEHRALQGRQGWAHHANGRGGAGGIADPHRRPAGDNAGDSRHPVYVVLAR